MARKKQFNELMIQRNVYLSEKDFKWLQDNRYSLTTITREKIAELKEKHENE